VTEHPSNTAEKRESAWIVTFVKYWRNMGIIMNCDRTSAKCYRKMGISMECERISAKYCRKTGNQHAM
jgi:hypothetical protein